MEIHGFTKEIMEKFFNQFIYATPKFNSITNREFKLISSTRSITREPLKTVSLLTNEELNNEEIEFKNDAALIYLKTFYSKKPEDFKNPEYIRECEEFLKRIDSSPNPDDLKKKIAKCIEENHVDFYSGDIPHSIYYARLRNVTDFGLSTDDSNVHMFISNTRSSVRFYVNPTQKDYRHFLTYLFEKSVEQELDIGAKTRMNHVGGNNADNLIVYTTTKDFTKVLQILNEYGKEFPEKVSEFNSSIEALGYLNEDWFGFGFDPQKGGGRSGTFNSFIDLIFNRYIFPILIFNDFDKIIEYARDKDINFKLENLIPAFTEHYFKKEVADQIIQALINKKLRQEFLIKYFDLSDIKNQSDEFTRINSELTEEQRENLSPIQYRDIHQKTDDILLNDQPIPLKLLNNSTIEIPRFKISDILQNIYLRDIISQYYIDNFKGNYEIKINQMLELWDNVIKNMPFISDKCPFLSTEMEKELEEWAKTNGETVVYLTEKTIKKDDVTIDEPEEIKVEDKTKTEEIEISEPIIEKVEIIEPTFKEVENKEAVKPTPVKITKPIEAKRAKIEIPKELKKHKNTIDILNKNKFEISCKVLEMGFKMKDIKGASHEDFQIWYINKIGLVKIIESLSLLSDANLNILLNNSALDLIIKACEADKTSDHKYENDLQALRNKRGAKIIETIKEMPKEETEEYFNHLTEYEKQDVHKIASFKKLKVPMDFIIYDDDFVSTSKDDTEKDDR